MHVALEDFSRGLSAIGKTETVVALREATMAALNLLGITKAFYVAPLSGDVRVGRLVTNMGLSWVWERQYRARLNRIDPLPRIALARLEPFYWPDQIADEKLSKQEGRYLAIAAQYGLGRGIGVPCFGPQGRAGFLGAIIGADAPDPEEADLQRVGSIGQASFRHYCKLIQHAQEMPALSNRELEVLHWIGRGKSNSVIAEILEISPSSVDVYVRRIFAKLDVTDRTTASVKAYSLGLLVSGDYERFVHESAINQLPEGKPPR